MATKTNIKNVVPLKPIPSKKEPVIPNTQQTGNNKQNVLTRTNQKQQQTNALSQSNKGGKNEMLQRPGQTTNQSVQKSNNQNNLSKSQVIGAKDLSGKNSRPINNLTKSLPTGIQNVQNGNQQNKAGIPPNKTGKNEQLQKSGLKPTTQINTNQTTNQSASKLKNQNNLTKSLPVGLQNVGNSGQKGQQSKGIRPLPDGQRAKNTSVQNVSDKKDAIQNKGQKAGNQTTGQKSVVQFSNAQKMQQVGQKPIVQNNNVQKTSQTQKTNIPQSNGSKLQQNGQKTGNQNNNSQKQGIQQSSAQKPTNGTQKPGIQQSNAQKNTQQKPGLQQSSAQKPQNTAQKPGIQQNSAKDIGLKTRVQPNNMQKSLQITQKPGVQQSNAKNLQTTGQKAQNTVQKPGTQMNNAQRPQQTKPGIQQNISQKPNQTGQKAGMQANNTQKAGAAASNTKQSQINKNEAQTKQGQKINQSNTVSKSQNVLNNAQRNNTKNQQGDNKTNQLPKKQGPKEQPGKQRINDPPGRGSRNEASGKPGQTNVKGQGDKKKKKNKQMERRPPPERPQIIEHSAGFTGISLAEAQLLIEEIGEMKGDRQYGALVDFLSQMFQKVQNLETGNYSRTEIEIFVRQFQDYNEGFHYRMESKPRGHALILTNSKFYKVPGDPWSYEFDNRPGAEIDADNLEKLFTDIGYLVTRRDNIKHWEMKWELKTMAEMDHTKFDSFICVISSHGNLNQVYGCDGLRMILSKQIRQFRSETCSTLAGKPKMFFLQSCQTEENDQIFRIESTVPEETAVKGKGGELEKSKFLINDVDFLVGYSTLPGNHSYRQEQSGSWYLNALYKNLKQNYKEYDIVTIMEDVNYDVNCKREEYNYIDSNQVSVFSSTLRGPLHFR